ncbi:glycoside hydrolase family 57 [Marichromatium bheemlicum]|uniref:Glycoside hydrolase family 57 n=1 Tax=Marichromatium bheemlicum TaxID=365339 RepID=A0ABX1I782_9GAMM|nr:glycoside hydrolase family 57 [Marichromatium bheemlicum]NKN33418.1 glycoside hydrolase family 57 [Marichromatium bheemlicum]
MTVTKIAHALGLHMHQPPGNLRQLIETRPGEAERIIRCYERVVRYAERFRDVAVFHVGFSGVLLEQLLDPEVVVRYGALVDIPAMLEGYRRAPNIELVGMGYSHPIFPLIARADWSEQLARGRGLVERVFGRAPRGFWPPELAFTMEMIPALVKAGYDYVVVDGAQVRPADGMSDVLRPYLACHHGACIRVVPRDRALSAAQRSGLDPDWFEREVVGRVAGSPRPQAMRLLTTWCDGENGDWLRQLHEPSGFFGHFVAPQLARWRDGESVIRPVSLGRYLDDFQPRVHARVQAGCWNVDAEIGDELSRWTASAGQRAAVAELARLSERYWALVRESARDRWDDALIAARQQILEAETSCYLYWGEAWLPYLRHRLETTACALAALERGRGCCEMPPLASTRHAPGLAEAEV